MSKKTAHRCCAAAIQRNFQARISSMYVDNFRRTIFSSGAHDERPADALQHA